MKTKPLQAELRSKQTTAIGVGGSVGAVAALFVALRDGLQMSTLEIAFVILASVVLANSFGLIKARDASVTSKQSGVGDEDSS